MKVLVLGGGGREHAITWALKRSAFVDELHCAPGNPGIGQLAVLHDVDPCDPVKVLDLVKELGVDLVAVGPEAPLVAGVADRLREAGVPVFGPGTDGARLEGSKAFSKNFMARWGIPTAPFAVCQTMEEAQSAISSREAPYIVKADGLAAGKGAFILKSEEEALEVCRDLLEEGTLGEAGRTLVIEDFLPGIEMTVLAVTDGKTIRVLPSSQDHKRAFDNDEGPNTGGMGAYSPVPWCDNDLMERVRKLVLEPTVKGLASDGIDFCGVIYAGIMLDAEGNPRVLEYNVRLGDPEAQVVLPAFPGDWGQVVLACCEGRLDEVPWPEAEEVAVGVVMASGGYPGKYPKGLPIEGLEAFSNEGEVLVFQAGTAESSGGKVQTNGGRVLTVVGIDADFARAREKAYQALSQIRFEGVHFRKDIGNKALNFQPFKRG